jgi:D-alanyl-D-alanine carboxypeptidase
VVGGPSIQVARTVTVMRTTMRSQRGRTLAAALTIALAGCTAPGGRETAGSVEQSTPSGAPATPWTPGESFPIAAFDDIREEPVSEKVAVEFQAALREMAGEGGMSATVMSPDGTWSGAVGKADGVRDVRIDDQFAIASVTKPVVAAQVMQMVEAGELALDDPAADHLPVDLDFDTNGATIRHLLSQRSGLPDYYPAVKTTHSKDPLRVWNPADLLELVPPRRAPAGDVFEYGDTNYLLLGLVIEHVRGRPVADVLRDGVLDIEGVERLIYQPDEVPTEPMAMPGGKSSAQLKKGGGYLPSLSSATADGPGAAMASDAPSLARWWRAFCAGEIVSQESLTEMATFRDEYGLGLFEVADPYAEGVGHTGGGGGYASWAGCLPEAGAVVVVLHNRVVEDIGGMAQPLVAALIESRSD